MFSRVYSGGIDGINSRLVNVEADVSNGMPEFVMIGFLSSEVKEAKDRVKTAIKNSGYVLPPKRITVNLAPADIKKTGTSYDLPIAAAILASVGIISSEKLKDVFIVGQLSLSGGVMRIKGVLPIVYNAMKAGFKKCLLPKDNAKEGAIVNGVEVIGIDSLKDMVEYIEDRKVIESEFVDLEKIFSKSFNKYTMDFSDINGQDIVKRAIEIAVCGKHNILMIGPPGSGKTMMAKRIPTIMSDLSIEESIEISKVYSVCGLLDSDNALINSRPFRSPHHTITDSALVGGGSTPHPGEISLASGGILFMDEFSEFRNNTLEVLRQPLEEKNINISRVNHSYRFPANFLLVAAMNPCKCGYFPDRNKCSCSIESVKRYLNKISKPLMDRIDICVEAAKVEYNNLINNGNISESSANIKERIVQAVKIQQDRYVNEDILFNGELSGKLIKKYCVLGKEEERILKEAFSKYNMSARMYHKIIKVARTIADLDKKEYITTEHLIEALCYRSTDNKFWR